jgi:cytochrome c oxidase assembly factor CtaG
VHDVEHGTLLVAYTLYWSPFAPFGHAVASLRTDAARTLYLTTGGAQSGLLGALLAFAGTPAYRHYAAAPSGSEVALADQQLGGMIMLLSGAVVFAVAGALTLRDE